MAEHPTLDHPQAYIPGDRRQALAAGIEMADRVTGAALFADVSGFTTLTEALAAEFGPQRGVEELTTVLNDVFHAVIDDITAFDGHVIYFSGDAVTCWLDGDDGTRAAAAALAVQQTMAVVGSVTTPAGREVHLGIKVAVAVGPARRFVVGDPAVQLIDVLAGAIVDELAESEQLADRGEIVLAASAERALAGRAVMSRRVRADGSDAAILHALTTPVERVPPTAEPSLDEALVRPWLLPVVHARLASGHGEFLAELRSAYPFFVRFAGIDFDDDRAPEELDVFIRRAQDVVSSFGGNVLQLTLGDKGAYLYGVFGSPVSHGDDAARAAAAALELRAVAAETAARDLQIGIGYGRVRSGTYGHSLRRTFTCLGDAVNLSARLMAKAPAGAIHVTDDVRRAAGDRFALTSVGVVPVKGRVEPVHIWSLEGLALATRAREVRYTLPLVGRDHELAVTAEAIGAVRSGRSRIVAIAAEAGRGKSRLVAEIVRGLRADGMPVAFGEASVVDANGSYVVWREVVQTLLGVDERATESARARSLRRALAAVGRLQARRAPLLGPVVGLDLPDTDVTRSFDAKLRKASLESLLLDVVAARARIAPLAIVLEDCHRIDSLSRDLLEVIVGGTEHLPVLFLLDYRPTGSPGGGLGLEGLDRFVELELDELGADAAGAAATAKLRQLYGDGVRITPEFIEAVVARAEGNPFYLEQILDFLHSRGVDPARPDQIGTVDLPGSLHALLLSRIDALDEGPRRTIKVASVLGRRFAAPMLRRVYPDLGSDDAVTGQLMVGRSADLVIADEQDRATWLFRHVITREVAYQSLPHALRSVVHARAGADLEAQGADVVEAELDLVAYHWWNSEDRGKKIEYLERAGAAAQARYANDAAVDYFERLAALLQDARRAEVLVRLGKVLELTGDWDRARQVAGEAATIAAGGVDRGLVARCEVSLAEVARRQGRYDDALAHLDRASQVYAETNDEAGSGQVLHLAGTVAAQRGDHAGARERYEASLEVRRRLGDLTQMASVLSNLGVVAEYEGDLVASRRYHEAALDLRSAVGDRWGIAVSRTNIGMIDVLEGRSAHAKASFEDAMRLNVEVGDRWMVAISHHNLANACRDLGDVTGACRAYRTAASSFLGYGDRWALAFLFEDVALLAAERSSTIQAWELLGAADACREAVGSPRPAALDADLLGRLTSTGDLTPQDGASARSRGRSFDIDDSVSDLIRLCDELDGRLDA